MSTKYGLAVDIGTTVICGGIYKGGTLVTGAARLNPQVRYGQDVISRICLAAGRAPGGGMSAEEGLGALTRCIQTALCEMTRGLAAASGIDIRDINRAVITGNTAMLYFLTGRSPDKIAQAPFAADCLFGGYYSALAPAAGLDESAAVFLPRCISAFIGADTVTAVLASGIAAQKKPALLMDIGTNGELVFIKDGKITCASAAAGPAFEGYTMTSGMGAENGAVDRVWIQDGKLRFSVIGGGRPRGICGSGMISACAALICIGVIDETGYMPGGMYEIAENVSISQEDIRRIQLAKAAVRAAAETLIYGEEPETLYIAGGFGGALDLNCAAKIGLIPERLVPVSRVIGNAALKGAALLLDNTELTEETERFAVNAEVIDLTVNKAFTDGFIRYMNFDNA